MNANLLITAVAHRSGATEIATRRVIGALADLLREAIYPETAAQTAGERCNQIQCDHQRRLIVLFMNHVRPVLCNVQNVRAYLSDAYPDITECEVLRHLDYLECKGLCKAFPVPAIQVAFKLTATGVEQAEAWALEERGAA